jgi:peptidoglycan/LPS O-acetylase OafA/YrhL
MPRFVGRSIPRLSDLPVIDVAKAIALLFIVADHIVEQFGASPYFFNPDRHWPKIGTQIAQVLQRTGPGPLGVVGAIVRDIAWLGDEGVGLLLTLSGFGLGWGLARAGDLDLRRYVLRRLGRMYPMWLVAHVVIAVPLAIAGATPFRVVCISALGVRFLPDTYFAIVPAWWFVGLLLQLYAIVPLLWWACKRFGALQMMAWTVVGGLVIRAIGFHYAGSYIDEWSRGAIFITRLPEFTFGFGLAVLCATDAKRFTAFVRDGRIVALAALAFALGNIAAMTWIGMVFAPLLTSFGSFVLVSAAFATARSAVLEWIGRHSYSLYLTHQFTAMVLIRAGAARTPLQSVLAVLASLASAVALALLLEWLTGFVVNGFARIGLRFGAVAPVAPPSRRL